MQISMVALKVQTEDAILGLKACNFMDSFSQVLEILNQYLIGEES